MPNTKKCPNCGFIMDENISNCPKCFTFMANISSSTEEFIKDNLTENNSSFNESTSNFETDTKNSWETSTETFEDDYDKDFTFSTPDSIDTIKPTHTTFKDFQKKIDNIEEDKTEENEESKKPFFSEEIHPFRRYFARYVDITIFSFLVFYVIKIFLLKSGSIQKIISFTNFLHTDKHAVLVNMLSFIFSFPLIAVSLSIFGTTPGKKLYGITIKNSLGNKLTPREAFLRELNVLIYGTGLGLQPFTLIAYFVAITNLSNEKITSWDKKLKTTIIHDETWTGRKQTMIIVITIILVALFSFKNI